MAETGPITAGQDGRRPSAARRQPGVTDGVDTVVDPQKPPAGRQGTDLRLRISERSELTPGDDPVLRERQRRQSLVGWSI